MGFGGLPKQPRLPPEILAFSSVFQVCFKCVRFFSLYTALKPYYGLDQDYGITVISVTK